MAEVLVEFAEPVESGDGRAYIARACGGPAPSNHGTWQGWLEFVPVDGGPAVRSSRETTQPNREDTVYWATGLTPVYLEGALERALNPLTKVQPAPAPLPVFDGPAPELAPPPPTNEAVLNPFSVYRKGEAALRSQLHAISAWHLVNIVTAYGLSEQRRSDLDATPAAVLVELIIAAVRQRAEQPAAG
jgi:hypothetical protein